MTTMLNACRIYDKIKNYCKKEGGNVCYLKRIEYKIFIRYFPCSVGKDFTRYGRYKIIPMD